jgi:hypothetical protein
MVRLSRPILAACLATLCGAGLAALPLRAQESEPAADAPLVDDAPMAEEAPMAKEDEPRTGSETFTSFISEVDACNRAQKLRPEGSVVTRMRYWREGEPEERRVSCKIYWSQKEDAKPTRRPILFGPSA